MASVEAGTSGLWTHLVPSSPLCAGPRGGQRSPCSREPGTGQAGPGFPRWTRPQGLMALVWGLEVEPRGPWGGGRSLAFALEAEPSPCASLPSAV